MTKTKFTSLAIAALTFVTGTALAGGEGSEPAMMSLPAGPQACVDQYLKCVNTGSDCCAKVEEALARIAVIEGQLKPKAPAPRNPNAPKVPTVAERLNSLRVELKAEIAKGDLANAVALNALALHLQQTINEFNALKAELEGLRGRVGKLEVNDIRQDADITIVQNDITEIKLEIEALKNAPAPAAPKTVALHLDAKLGVLAYSSELYTYAAGQAIGGLRLDIGKVSLSLEGGMLVSDNAEDHGALGEVVVTHQLGKGFGLGLGGQYFVGGFAKDQQITFDGLNGLLRLEYLNGIFIANVDGLLGRAGNFTDGGSRELGYGAQAQFGINLF